MNRTLSSSASLERAVVTRRAIARCLCAIAEGCHLAGIVATALKENENDDN